MLDLTKILTDIVEGIAEDVRSQTPMVTRKTNSSSFNGSKMFS